MAGEVGLVSNGRMVSSVSVAYHQVEKCAGYTANQESAGVDQNTEPFTVFLASLLAGKS